MNDRAKHFLSRVICEFLNRWKPDVRHGVAHGEGEVIDLGPATATDKLLAFIIHNVFPRP